MDLSLNEQQQMLKQGVEEFVAREATRDVLVELAESEDGYSESMWRSAAGIGWLGMATPEQYGGSATELMDIAVVFEALGYAPVPGPFFSSGVLAPLIIQEAGSDEQQQQYLPRLANGESIATLAVTEPDWAWGPDGVNMRARSQNGGYVLDGTKLFVYDGHCADTLITAVRTDDADGVSLVVVDATAPGVSARRMKGFLSSESEVRFDNVEVPASAMLGAPGSGQGALDRALLKATPILCAYKVGGSQAVYDLSVEYSRERKQFGQPIGRFQHVQNHIVQLVNNLDAARWTTYEVLWKLDSGKPDAEVSMHLAKAVSSEAYIQATNYAHEVHAGVGVMREYGLTLFTQLSRSLYHALGDPGYHQRKLGDLLVDYMPEAAG